MTEKLKTILLFSSIPLILILSGFLAYQYFSAKKPPQANSLPYFDPYPEDGKPHRVKDFQFTDQHGHPLNRKMMEGKIYVAEFFFCTCPSICPIMNKQLQRTHEHFLNEVDFAILSHTVKPEEDSLPVLLQYAGEHGSDGEKWKFLRGDKQTTFDMARNAYLVAEPDYQGGADFVHTELFSLVDKRGRVRGLYDGTDVQAVDSMMRDIETLLHEQAINY